ncbi:MAG: KaiA-binding protein [Chloroflexi bacterium]|nr:MAG: KaiA-binding protein [Chloroflexota bacterium]
MEQSAFLATGVPQLDLILGGGIVERSLLLIAGLAGSGKTVLAAQIAFAAAHREERVLFVTAFSEPHDKLISNLHHFQFFEPNMIGERIKLLNLQHQLSASVAEAGETIVREARAHRAQLVVLDGFQGVSVTSQTSLAPHQFLYDLNAKLSLLGITSVITYNYAPTLEGSRPELTAVDGIVWLAQELMGDQAVRMLQVVKQRGANPLLGRHSFKLDNSGLVCYPRQEAVTTPKDVPPGNERATFGIAELDAMLRGGLTQGTNTIIAGAEGVGKTLLSLKFVMQGIANGERAIIITFNETAQQLVAKGARFGLDLQAAIDQGQLRIQYYPVAELNADMVAQELRDAVTTTQIQRLVIDGLYEIELPLIKNERAHGFFASLITFLRSQQITTCITLEIDPLIGRELSFVGKTFSALAENVLLMRRSEVKSQFLSTIDVLKMRFSAHDRTLHEYTIEDNGFRISATSSTRTEGKRRRSI